VREGADAGGKDSVGMLTVFLMRHGATSGNLAGRYNGCRIDEPLCDLGIEQANARKKDAPACDTVFSSPLKRALQTAGIIYPDKKPVVIQDLRECDFGDFAGKTAGELSGNPDYRAWVDSNCETPVPGGEDVAAFKQRCVKAFIAALETLRDNQTVVFVIHGGSIMAILEYFNNTEQNLFESCPKNCGYVKCLWKNGKLVIQGERA